MALVVLMERCLVSRQLVKRERLVFFLGQTAHLCWLLSISVPKRAGRAIMTALFGTDILSS
jgi:hypothetical protein